MQTFRYLPEAPDNPVRLGRHQVHDALAPARQAKPHRSPMATVTHDENEPVWDQGRIGDCTANAALGCLVTEPFAKQGETYTETDAVSLYKLETSLDDSQIPGRYPDVDTGSTGPWSMLALEKLGKITGWRHTRSAYTALSLMTYGPISLGIPWLKSMFAPDRNNVIVVDDRSGLAGGHQIALTVREVTHQLVLIRQSWGRSWGDDGHAWLSWHDLAFLLSEGGDVVQPEVS